MPMRISQPIVSCQETVVLDASQEGVTNGDRKELSIVGGFIIAFSEVTVTYAYKRVATYLLPSQWAPEGLIQLLGTDYKFAVSFFILVAVLLIRPTGIFRGQSL